MDQKRDSVRGVRNSSESDYRIKLWDFRNIDRSAIKDGTIL